MNTLIRTAQFSAWLKGLKDAKGVAASILARVDRAQKGNFGDSKSLKGGLSEMRVDVGPGIECISRNAGKRCMCSWPEGTRDPRIAISHRRGK
jgi:putative addiction module killer protein